MKKSIGVIDGMGPYAGAYFYRLLLDKSRQLYGARNNDDYPFIHFDSLPVPDFISDTNNLSAAEHMLQRSVAQMVERGCDSFAIVCNTAHILYPQLTKISDGRLISLIDVVCQEAKKRGYTRVGVLATPTTIRTNLYGEGLGKYGIETVYDNSAMQRLHEKIVRDVVAGELYSLKSKDLYRMTKKFIKDEHLDGVILGCTELPLVFPKKQESRIIDCLEVISTEMLRRYYDSVN